MLTDIVRGRALAPVFDRIVRPIGRAWRRAAGWPLVAALCAATAPAMGYGMWLIDHAATGRARFAGLAMFFAVPLLAVAALLTWRAREAGRRTAHSLR